MLLKVLSIWLIIAIFLFLFEKIREVVFNTMDYFDEKLYLNGLILFLLTLPCFICLFIFAWTVEGLTFVGNKFAEIKLYDKTNRKIEQKIDNPNPKFVPPPSCKKK